MDGNSTSQASKRLATIVAVLTFCAGSVGAQHSHAAGVWTNEPAGANVVVDCNFSSTPGACGILDAYSSAEVASDSSAPLSPSGVLKSTLRAGNSAGGMQLNFATPKPNNREMFMGIIWRTNPEFQGRPNSNKLFFLRGPQANGVWIFGNSALVNGSAPLIFGHNTGGGLLDNSHACSADLGLLCFPNVGPGLLTRGVWTKIEAYVKSSTTNTSRDGIVRWWINGVLVGNYTNLNYGGTAGINEWVWSETWDGGVNPLPTVDWNHFIDHLHISIPNGGSGSDIPPGPPAQPTLRSITVP